MIPSLEFYLFDFEKPTKEVNGMEINIYVIPANSRKRVITVTNNTMDIATVLILKCSPN